MVNSALILVLVIAITAVVVTASVRRWRRAASAGTEPRTASPARVLPPYSALHAYLEHRYAANVVLTFEQIESLLGCSLPPRARSEREWWTRPSGPQDLHADAWTVAGRTATPNLLARNVAFDRVF